MREFHRALSVVCDDLFFARYRQSSTPATTLAQSEATTVDDAARALLSAMYGDAYTELEKSDLVGQLLDVRLLPGTDAAGVHFNKEQLDDR